MNTAITNTTTTAPASDAPRLCTTNTGPVHVRVAVAAGLASLATSADTDSTTSVPTQ